jgi:pimeloyl-ACP methyl ester carboxylesterase
MRLIRTDVLEIAYEEEGSSNSPPVLLLHGWPDAPCGWDAIAPMLHGHGWRTIVPFLRGTGRTRFLSAEIPRVGSGVALAQDAVDFADAIGLDRFAIVGHDWGARVAYILAALFPERVTSISGLALAFQPHGCFVMPAFGQARRFWYQWLMCVEGGAAKIAADPVGFARLQWETWSPAGWFGEAEFATTAQSFLNPDWPAITLNAYRSRWLKGETSDSRYDALQTKLSKIGVLSVPTLMIQGGSDFCDDPGESEGLERHFTGGYERLLLDGVGHFPHREASADVSAAILRHLGRSYGRR